MSVAAMRCGLEAAYVSRRTSPRSSGSGWARTSSARRERSVVLSRHHCRTAALYCQSIHRVVTTEAATTSATTTRGMTMSQNRHDVPPVGRCSGRGVRSASCVTPMTGLPSSRSTSPLPSREGRAHETRPSRSTRTGECTAFPRSRSRRACSASHIECIIEEGDTASDEWWEWRLRRAPYGCRTRLPQTLMHGFSWVVPPPSQGQNR